MQAVILAGGLGTRLRPITDTLPKVMVPVCGRPFMEYQLEVLARRGIEDVVICLGHLGHMIEDHFGDGRDFGISIRYSADGDGLLGTAGAIRNAEGLLASRFFVVNGDLYPVIDFRQVMRYFKSHESPALMVVFRNADRWDLSNVIIDRGFVRVYDREQRRVGMVHIDFGVSVFRREAFAHIPRGMPADLPAVYQPLIGRGQLLAYETPQRFYEVGSPDGLHEFEDLVQSGHIRALSNAPVRRSAVDA